MDSVVAIRIRWKLMTGEGVDGMHDLYQLCVCIKGGLHLLLMQMHGYNKLFAYFPFV